MYADRALRRIERLRSTMKFLVMFALLASTIAYAYGYHDGHERANKPDVLVCHAPSEDSLPTDCDYSNGTWTPRKVNLPDQDKPTPIRAYSLPDVCVQKWGDGTREISCAYDPTTRQWVRAPWLYQKVVRNAGQ